MNFFKSDASDFQRSLARFNQRRLALQFPSFGWADDLRSEFEYRIAEGEFIESMREKISSEVPARWASSEDFVGWFAALVECGPGQNHPFFDWLANDATLPQIRWFLTQEAAGEAGFDDLLAMTQVKLPAQPKLECARNFWDEMGHGKHAAMHGEMLARMVREMSLLPSIDTTVVEALTLSNMMIGLATSRRYAYHAIGALGVIELTAPPRVKKVSMAMRRVGLDGKMRAYFDLHAALDVAHSSAWIKEVIRPLVDLDPSCAKYIAEGALMRLACGRACFDRYRQVLKSDTAVANVICEQVPTDEVEQQLCE